MLSIYSEKLNHVCLRSSIHHCKGVKGKVTLVLSDWKEGEHNEC